jgi:hypothetical protein
MINISDDERRRAHSVWLRSGRLPSVRSADGIEFKFNPWHDPGSGRFTFVGAGRHYGQWGGGGSSGGKGGGGDATGSWAQPSQPKSQITTTRASQEGSTQTASPSKRSAPSQPSTRGTWAGGGFTGGDGGSFGGTGASGTWGVPEPKRRPIASGGSATAIGSLDRSEATNTVPPRPAIAPSEQFRTVVLNGYTYQIDA